MASLTIRQLDEDVKAKLRIQAAEHGHSMEAEVRLILSAAVAEKPTSIEVGIATRIQKLVTQNGAIELPAQKVAETRKPIPSLRHLDFTDEAYG